MGYGEVGLGLGHLLTRVMGAPTTQTHAHGVWWGLGWGHEFALAIKSLPCHLLARPTPGFKPTPMGPRPKPTPQPKPPGWWLGRFQPTHAPTQTSYPIALSIFTVFGF
ncbi:hypothetical protein Hanom_Chr14g01312001 [Helianthus anomalus]